MAAAIAGWKAWSTRGRGVLVGDVLHGEALRTQSVEIVLAATAGGEDRHVELERRV